MHINYLKVEATKAPKSLSRFLAKTKSELDTFWGSGSDTMPIVYLLQSRKEIDLLHGHKTPDWLVGWAKQNTIKILHPDTFERYSSHSKAEFLQIMKHEYCHLYTQRIAKAKLPTWLNEGISCHFALQGKTLPSKKNALKIFGESDLNELNYSVGPFWVDLLIKKYGKAKLIKLAKLSASSSFDAAFKKTYGLSFTKSSGEKLIGSMLK